MGLASFAEIILVASFQCFEVPTASFEAHRRAELLRYLLSLTLGEVQVDKREANVVHLFKKACK